MSKIVIDPVTRIEGHLRVETAVNSGVVSGAWSTGTLFRGLETILTNRDPRDAWMMTQRICGVCTYVHGLASVRCMENSLGLTVPANARLVRNILMGAQYIHDHIVHFYHLNALDWVNVGSALTADPADAKAADDLICSARGRSVQYFSDLITRLSTFSGRSQLGPFANGDWEHPGYRLTAAQNLVLVANYLEALSVQREIATIHAYLGGKNPHPQSLLIGGITQTTARLQLVIPSVSSICTMAKSFIDNYYLPDVAFVAKSYKGDGYADTGGCDNLLCVGEFPQDGINTFFPSGVITGRNHTSIGTVNVAGITEDVTRSWYTGTSVLHPSVGVTTPEYTGVDITDKYSWLKAPRYNGAPMEVGPLARVMVAYGKNTAGVRDLVNSVVSLVGLTDISQMYSTLGRVAARAIETKLIADALPGWISELVANISQGNTATRSAFVLPATTCEGFSLSEAPRGALGHWVKYTNGLTVNYQMVVPSTWNFSPRDHDGIPGPVEQALIGRSVYNEARPLEILRVVHSFDPCIACAVH